MISSQPEPTGDPARRTPESRPPEGEPPSLAALAQSLRFRLEASRAMGWSPLLRRPPQQEPIQSRTPAADGPGAPTPAARRGAPPAEPRRELAATFEGDAERQRRQALLDELDAQVAGCRECALCEGRTRTVFGVGDPCARLLFVGEGPGFDEDRLGEPFVGRAGKLLDRMLAAMGLHRSVVYIANIVKCRPPGNRAPEAREMIACFPYLSQQIQIVKPEVICTLGNTPTRFLLQTQAPISRIRGSWHEYEGIAVLPTFHPAYLLRNERDKGLAWADLKQVLQRLGLPVPQRKAR